MKLSDLKPCATCGGTIAPVFYRVRIDNILIDPQATNQVLGLNQVFGGQALGLAEAMAPVDDVTITMHTVDVFVCNECFMDGKHLDEVYCSEDGKETAE
jgi:hypothetical protein